MRFKYRQNFIKSKKATRNLFKIDLKNKNSQQKICPIKESSQKQNKHHIKTIKTSDFNSQNIKLQRKESYLIKVQS